MSKVPEMFYQIFTLIQLKVQRNVHKGISVDQMVPHAKPIG